MDIFHALIVQSAFSQAGFVMEERIAPTVVMNCLLIAMEERAMVTFFLTKTFYNGNCTVFIIIIIIV